VKTEWGFNKFLSLDSFNCHCNGYLVNDCCVFGAEVFVHERSGKQEFLSLIKDPPNGVMTWKLENFSALNKAAYYSQVFAIGDLKWYFYYWKLHFYWRFKMVFFFFFFFFFQLNIGFLTH
jgi:hypothetical protein